MGTTTSYRHRLFEKLRNKPFWIWNVKEHKHIDIETKGDCCFSHIIGLPTKERIDKPIFDYQRILYDSLYIPNTVDSQRRAFNWELAVKDSMSIRVIAICPGEVDTKMQADLDPEYYRRNKNKMLRPKQIAEKIAEMISDKWHKYHNGQSVEIG